MDRNEVAAVGQVERHFYSGERVEVRNGTELDGMEGTVHTLVVRKDLSYDGRETRHKYVVEIDNRGPFTFYDWEIVATDKEWVSGDAEDFLATADQ